MIEPYKPLHYLSIDEVDNLLSKHDDDLKKDNIEFYSVGGRRLFEIRDSTGSPVSTIVTILIARREHICHRFTIVLSMFNSKRAIEDEVIRCITIFKQQLANGTAIVQDMNGGSFGLGDNL